jgi:hypothetical protein
MAVNFAKLRSCCADGVVSQFEFWVVVQWSAPLTVDRLQVGN